VFQSLEQAHHLVFGHGIVPWEFQVGLRCWLIPLGLAGVMALAHLVFQAPLAGLILIRLMLCVASLSIVWCAAGWGQRFYGRPGLWIAGGLAALWPDLWLMAPHPLEEILAADVLVPAIYLVESSSARANMLQVALAGFLLGLALTLRIQLAPAIAIAGIALCRRDLQSWRVALLAGALPLLAAGMLDWYAWGQPFRSFWLNIYLNLVLGVAKDEFGASPAMYFGAMLTLDWLWTLPVLIFLIWRGARLIPVAGAAALAVVLAHSLISHKEFRFIYPAIALAIPLAGLGLSELWLRMKLAGALNVPRLCFGILLLAGPLFSPWVYFNLAWQANSFRIFQDAANLPVSLVSVEGLEVMFASNKTKIFPLDILFPSSMRLTRQTSVSLPSGTTAADAIIASQGTDIPPVFHVWDCVRGNWIPLSATPQPKLCIWLRPSAPGAAGTVLPFEFPFPAKARPFMVPDRMLRE
jgi:hypothetical protein